VAQASDSSQAGPVRLKAVADLVAPCRRLADIGSDHGLLPRYLLSAGRVYHCIATERDRRRLINLRGFPPRHPLAGRLEIRVGDGLDALRPADRIDTVVIAGLGARTIVRLLEGGRARRLGVSRMVLQPQAEIGRLRRWLAEDGYTVVAERLALERGRFYEALAAEPSPQAVVDRHPTLATEDLYEVGPCLVRSGDPMLRRLWTARMRRLERILERAKSGPGRGRAGDRRAQALRILSALESVPTPRDSARADENRIRCHSAIY
jgi:tRNA (adenine22-N1)-methyltransferase